MLADAAVITSPTDLASAKVTSLPSLSPPSSRPPDSAFCRRLPKVELHAHLTGSITKECLQEIWERRTRLEGDLGIEPPIKALADPSVSQSINSFFSHFNHYIYKLVSTPEALAYATRSVLNHFANDGVVHLELRTTPRALGNGTVSAEDAVRTVLAVIENWNLSAANIPSPTTSPVMAPMSPTLSDQGPSTARVMRASLILSVDRARHDLKQANDIVTLASTLRDEGLPVVGIDLSGDPHSPNEVARLAPAFLRAHSLGFPLALHYAEVPSSSSEEELEELLSWQPKRLGHAIHVPMSIRQRILEQGIAPELCLSCNVLARMLPDTVNGGLHTSPSYEDHHFGWWWSANSALSLGTDDVGVFGSTSSQEHEHVARWWGVDRRGLLQLSERAMKGAFADDAECRRVERLFKEFERSERLVC